MIKFSLKCIVLRFFAASLIVCMGMPPVALGSVHSTNVLSPKITITTNSFFKSYRFLARSGNESIIHSENQISELENLVDKFHIKLMKIESPTIPRQLHLAHELFRDFFEKPMTYNNLDLIWAEFIRKTVLRNTTTSLSKAIDLQLLPLLQKKEHVGLDDLKAFEQMSSSLNPYEKLLFYSACGRIQYPDVPFEELNIFEIIYSPEKDSLFMNISNTDNPDPIYSGDIIFHSISTQRDNILDLASGAGRYTNNNFSGYIGKGYNFYCFMKILEQLLINYPDVSTLVVTKKNITGFHPVRAFIFYMSKAGFNLYPPNISLLTQERIERLKKSPIKKQIITMINANKGVYRDFCQEEEVYRKSIKENNPALIDPKTIPISRKHANYSQLIMQAI